MGGDDGTFEDHDRILGFSIEKHGQERLYHFGLPPLAFTDVCHLATGRVSLSAGQMVENKRLITAAQVAQALLKGNQILAPLIEKAMTTLTLEKA